MVRQSMRAAFNISSAAPALLGNCRIFWLKPYEALIFQRAQMDVYIKGSFSGWQPIYLWGENMCDGIGANIAFPYKTYYFWLKQIFVGLFVVFSWN